MMKAGRRSARGKDGFSLIEMIVSLAVLMIVSATALGGVMNLTKTSGTVNNRTEMHAGVRNATELLQQEVGQAGRITIPANITLAAARNVGDTTLTVSSATGIYVGEYLAIGTGGDILCQVGCEETIKVNAIAGTQITIENNAAVTKGHRELWYTHAAGAPVRVSGGFAYGVVPTAEISPGVTTNVVNGSTGSVLKIFGDINGNGAMVYIEYSCEINPSPGVLRRRVNLYTDAVKQPMAANQVLLNNIIANPDGTACFTYQQKMVGATAFVTDVAITLTVQTAERDPGTGLFQNETKALLNVSPRNVFNVWQLAGLGLGYRVQPIPPSVTLLLPQP